MGSLHMCVHDDRGAVAGHLPQLEQTGTGSSHACMPGSHAAAIQELMVKLPQVKVIINDRVDVAIAAGADGVHVGQDDMPCQAVRSLVGPDMIIGVSCKTPEQARAAAAAGADYLGVGAGAIWCLWAGVWRAVAICVSAM